MRFGTMVAVLKRDNRSQKIEDLKLGGNKNLKNIGERIIMFKKYTTTFLMAIMMAVAIPVFVSTAAAQTRYYVTRSGRVYMTKRPNFYRRHRKAINIGAGTAAGMLVGGLVGGRKGLLIGGLAGAGGGALFTHYQKPKHYTRRYYLGRVGYRRHTRTRRTYRNY